MPNKNKALIISTIEASGPEQMSLDLHFLNETIRDDNILFTLRFYLWKGNWISIGYHQKNLPDHWNKLSKEGIINVVKRPSGGGAVLHSGGITYSLTFKKPEYRKFSYQIVNNWLIKSFYKIGLNLDYGSESKSTIQKNCFGSSFTSDLVDETGFKRIGSAQYWRKGSFLQHGEIQLNPSNYLWKEIFRENAPPPIKLKLNRNELIEYLKKSFIDNYSQLSTTNINLKGEDIFNKIKLFSVKS